ncbi:hypothetical protein ACRAWF_45505 [Streptomyces sp. L7]
MNVRIAAVSWPPPRSSPSAPPPPSPRSAPAPSITLKANHTTVKLGDVVTFTGKSAGLKEGSKVTLQVKSGATSGSPSP